MLGGAGNLPPLSPPSVCLSVLKAEPTYFTDMVCNFFFYSLLGRNVVWKENDEGPFGHKRN